MARARFPWLYAVLAVAASALGAKLGPAAQAGCTDPKSGIVCPSPDDPSVATVALTVLSGHSGAFDGGNLVLQLQAPSGRAFSVPDGTTLALSLSAGLSGPSCAAHTDSVSLLGTAAALQLLDAGGVPSAPQGASELAMVNSSLSAASSPLAVVRAVPFAASPSANVAVFFSSVVLRVNASALGAPAACTSWATRELQVSEARLEFRVPASDVGAPEDQVRVLSLPPSAACPADGCGSGGSCANASAPSVSSRATPVCECASDKWGTACEAARGSSPATCFNGRRDGAETGVDCGGADCPKCGAGQLCASASDCGSGTASCSPVPGDASVTTRCLSSAVAAWQTGTRVALVSVQALPAVPGQTSGGSRLARLLNEPGGAGSTSAGLFAALDEGASGALEAGGGPAGGDGDSGLAQAAVVSVRVGRCVADAAGNDCAEEGVELVVAVRLAAGAAAEDGAGRLTVALADGSVLARWLKLAPLAGVAAVWRAGGAAVEATAGNTSPPAAPADDGMAGVYVGLALLGVTILGGCVVLVVIECTSEKDAFGRGPLEQAAAANCLCLDRSISRLNRGINGQFTSASSPDTTEVVPGSASPAAGAGAHKPAREDAKPSAGSPVTNPLAVVRPQRPRQVSPDGAAAAPPGSPP
ncbi:hypothetical protein FNF31_04409 [Cafeteria roenbergensis]|uniref:EGF-like domain-containing protein n=1 Tax=Cafeteria roenbergensis TaxID=33653 RepID=A0A5A8D443_CAFRO|nr:hypothetical protein FNF31_04409 [Cafeteria roenbergensis]